MNKSDNSTEKTRPNLIPLPSREACTDEEMAAKAEQFHQLLNLRRTVRDFSDRPIDRRIIEDCLRAAGTAPSGANLQPWQFVVVSDRETKQRIRVAAEAEEREFYAQRAPQDWLDALAPIGTDANKPFLEIAPYLIVIFRRTHDLLPDGHSVKQYYSSESVGIATGMLITALHQCGLSTLTHTPAPMEFLNEILDRPSNERPFLILVVGHAAENAQVPDIARKPLDEIATFV